MRRIPLPAPVADIYKAVSALEMKYGRKFTPDGHLVGSIGEVIAKEAFELELYPMSHSGHDARDRQGRDVQIKLTSGNCVALYASCDRLIVMRIVSPEEAEVIYDGDGDPAVRSFRVCGAVGEDRTNPRTVDERSQLATNIIRCSELRDYKKNEPDPAS